jgi:hypothetical protein
VSLNLILFFGFVTALLLVLGWALWKPRVRMNLETDPRSLEDRGQRHTNYLPQIRQALAAADYDFLAERGSRGMRRRVRRERLNVALAYLSALRGDFESLLKMARAIAVLSPEVAAAHEFERLRLTAEFAWRCQMIRWKLLAGMTPLTQLAGLSDLVSGLSVRLEQAMKDLGERAAIAAEMASSMNHRGMGAV